jgi:hypothetical protein
MVITVDPNWFVNIARVALLVVAGVDVGLSLRNTTVTPTHKYVTWAIAAVAVLFVALDLGFGLNK